MKTQNIKAADIHNFIKNTHEVNLNNIKDNLSRGERHFLLPENWCKDEQSKEVLYQAINAIQLLGTK